MPKRLKGGIKLTKFIMNEKVYDTETSEKVIEYLKYYPLESKILGRTMYIKRSTALYKTKKGAWFSVSEHDGNKLEAHREDEITVKKVFTDLNRVELFNKYFDKLEEA